MIPWKKVAFLLAICVCPSLFLAGQDKEATTAFLAKQRSAVEFRESVRKDVLAYENTLDTHCQNVVIDFDSADVKDQIFVPVTVDDKGAGTAGRWRESIPATACGVKRTYNVDVEVKGKGLKFTPLYPGDAAGNPLLQKDTLKKIEFAMQFARVPNKKSCHIAVVDTHADGPPSTKLDSGLMSRWKEIWDVQSCGTVYTAPVTYTPDATGTSVGVSLDIKPR